MEDIVEITRYQDESETYRGELEITYVVRVIREGEVVRMETFSSIEEVTAYLETDVFDY